MAASHKRKSPDTDSQSFDSSSDDDNHCSTSPHIQVELNKRTVRTSHGMDNKLNAIYSSYSCKKCLFWCVSPDPECISTHLADNHPHGRSVSLPMEGNFTQEKADENNSVNYTYHCLRCSFNYSAEVLDSSQMKQHYSECHKNILERKTGASHDEIGTDDPDTNVELFERKEHGHTPCVVCFVKCVSCDFIHPSYESVVCHYTAMHTTPRYLCKACLKAFHNLAQFTIHLHTDHPLGLPKDQIVLPESHLEGKQMEFILEGPGDIYDRTLGDYVAKKSYNTEKCNGVSEHLNTGLQSTLFGVSNRETTKLGSKSLKELLATKPLTYNVEASRFYCRYNKSCNFSAPNQTEVVLNHILTEHNDIMSDGTVIALKTAVQYMYDTKTMNNNKQGSVMARSNSSTPMSSLLASDILNSHKSRNRSQEGSTSNAHFKEEKRESSASSDFPVKVKSEPEDSDSEISAGAAEDTLVGSKQDTRWWQAENTCPGILLHNGLKELSCRHQGVGGATSDEMLMMYLCRDCGYWCFNISSDCILQHVRQHMAQARLAQHWDREGPRFAELVPVKPEELSPRRNWRRDPFAFFARVPVPRVSGRLVFTVWICPMCDFVHPYHNMAIVHLRIEHFNNHQVYSCSLCKYGGPSETVMMQHFRDCHWQDVQAKAKVTFSQYEQFLVYNEEEAENLESLICEAALKLVGITLSFSREHHFLGQAETTMSRKKRKQSNDD